MNKLAYDHTSNIFLFPLHAIARNFFVVKKGIITKQTGTRLCKIR